MQTGAEPFLHSELSSHGQRCLYLFLMYLTFLTNKVSSHLNSAQLFLSKYPWANLSIFWETVGCGASWTAFPLRFYPKWLWSSVCQAVMKLYGPVTQRTSLKDRCLFFDSRQCFRQGCLFMISQKWNFLMLFHFKGNIRCTVFKAVVCLQLFVVCAVSCHSTKQGYSWCST